jgi:hypothetical protein
MSCQPNTTRPSWLFPYEDHWHATGLCPDFVRRSPFVPARAGKGGFVCRSITICHVRYVLFCATSQTKALSDAWRPVMQPSKDFPLCALRVVLFCFGMASFFWPQGACFKDVGTAVTDYCRRIRTRKSICEPLAARRIGRAAELCRCQWSSSLRSWVISVMRTPENAQRSGARRFAAAMCVLSRLADFVASAGL